MIYKFKTTTGILNHSNSGISFTNENYTECQLMDIIKLYDQELIDWLNSGIIIYNNGETDCSAEVAINTLEWTGNNFSYKNINTGINIAISEEQQMIVYGNMKIDGTIGISGDIILLDI